MHIGKTAQTGPKLIVRLAQDDRDLRASQRLRYKVFVQEKGGTGPLVDHENQLECDAFDPVFDHLLLIDPSRDADALDHVVGVYRLLRGSRLGASDSFYCDAEFDLSPLKATGRSLLELGRSCIHPDYRGGTALLLLWQGLADYVQAHQIDILFGAASFQGTDITRHMQALSWLHHHHLAPETLRVAAQGAAPFVPLALSQIDQALALRAIPSLIKAYLRIGGKIGEGVFIDHAFGTTDICIIVDTKALTAQAATLGRGLS